MMKIYPKLRLHLKLNSNMRCLMPNHTLKNKHNRIIIASNKVQNGEKSHEYRVTMDS